MIVIFCGGVEIVRLQNRHTSTMLDTKGVFFSFYTFFSHWDTTKKKLHEKFVLWNELEERESSSCCRAWLWLDFPFPFYPHPTQKLKIFYYTQNMRAPPRSELVHIRIPIHCVLSTFWWPPSTEIFTFLFILWHHLLHNRICEHNTIGETDLIVYRKLIKMKIELFTGLSTSSSKAIRWWMRCQRETTTREKRNAKSDRKKKYKNTRTLDFIDLYPKYSHRNISSLWVAGVASKVEWILTSQQSWNVVEFDLIIFHSRLPSPHQLFILNFPVSHERVPPFLTSHVVDCFRAIFIRKNRIYYVCGQRKVRNSEVRHEVECKKKVWSKFTSCRTKETQSRRTWQQF